MKKVMLALVLGILVLGFAVADNDNGMQDRERDGSGEYHDDMVATGGMNGSPNQIQSNFEIRENIKDGEYNIDGQKLRIEHQENMRTRLQANGDFADTDLELEERQDNTRRILQARLSNGRNTEIKIMPDRASETALARLRIRNCNESNNCTIELKEVGEGPMVRVAYELKAEKRAKVFGLFQAKMQVSSQINAENGEVIQEKRPWWAFLASEEDEEIVEEESLE